MDDAGIATEFPAFPVEPPPPTYQSQPILAIAFSFVIERYYDWVCSHMLMVHVARNSRPGAIDLGVAGPDALDGGETQ